MGGNRRNREKRKHSSGNSGGEQWKTPRHGRTPPDKSSCSNVNVSESIRIANSVLFNETVSDSDISVNVENSPVFASGDTETKEQTTIMADQTSVKQVNCSPKSIDDIFAYLRKLDDKITNMDKRLDKLDVLESKVSNFEGELTKLRVFVTDNLNSVSEKVSKVVDRVEGVEFAMGMAQDSITHLQADRARLQDELLYVQAQSMRNNLIFANIPEKDRETPQQTEEALKSFIVEKLKLAQDMVDQIGFERVHRMGQVSNQGRQARKIVAKFTLFKDRETVRRQKRELEGTNFFLHEQFPRAIAERRRALVPRMKAAIREGKRSWISYDTLYIDGVAVRDNSG